MLNDTANREPIEAVAAEYAERCRYGERVSIEEYAQRFPDLADEIRELFPAINAMEQLNAKRTMDSDASSSSVPEQLGDYRVIGEIARGGMGIVYEAEQITLGRRVAVKILPQHALRRERDIRRFEREAQTAAKLHHSNIVPVFGVGHDDGYHYIVMQLIRGVGLDEILNETKRLVTGEQDSITSARSSTVKRSAIGLLESELRRDTAVNCNTETVVSSSSDDVSRQEQRQIHAPPVPNLLQIQSVVGTEYYKNVARIGLQAAQALHYAHVHDTLHRDVKPGNLLLDAEGCVWVADFGLAKALEGDNSVTNSGDVVGTLAYVAPERFQGVTTERSDIYSLGLTLHEMLTLRRAFTGKDRVTIINQVASERLQSPRKINPNVPRDLETIVMKAASQDAADRYATAGLLANDLEAYLADRPIQARRLSVGEHAIRWSRRNRSMAALAASVVFLLATVFGVTLTAYFHSEQQRQESDVTTKLAVSLLDEIVTQFTSGDLRIPVSNDPEGADGQLGNATLPLSKDVAFMLDRMLPFYDKFSHRANDSQFVAIKSISAIGRVGDIHRRLGELADAQRSYEEAIRRIEQLRPTLGNTEDVRLASAKIHNGLGIVLLQEDRHTKDAAKQHRKAIALLDVVGTSENEQFELARSLYLLRVSTRRHKDNQDGHESLERAKALLSQLQERHPNRADYQFLLARCLLANGSGCGADGALNENQARAINILEALVKESPANPEYQFELGDTYRSIEWGEFREYHKTGRDADQLARSVSRLQRALEVTASLELRHPNIPQYNLSQKRLHHFLAAALQEQGKLGEAADSYLRAIEKQRLVVSQAKDPHWHQVGLGDLELNYGKLLRELKKFEESRKLLDATANRLELLTQHSETKSNENLRGRAEQILAATYVALASVEEDPEKVHELLRKAERTGS